ncbi:regulatory subunit of cyclin-dependent kinase [Mycena floridula]|nr:regulatory subunit of cyclin-dependent kinase [Mycena floridula]
MDKNHNFEDAGEEQPDAAALKAQKLAELFDKIRYSDNYTDDTYVYRHVTLPKQLLKIVPQDYWNQATGALRLLSEEECRLIGVMQSPGWCHYASHAPEPQILLFRRHIESYPETQGRRK